MDIRFTLLGVPVRIVPSFWLMAIVLGAGGGTSAVGLSAWVAAVCLSVLIHEFGHALTARAFGSQPAIELYSMGGVTRHGRLASRLQDTVVIAAGPGAGFLFAAAIAALLMMTGTSVWVTGSLPWMNWQPLTHEFGDRLLRHLAYINIGWGLINLLPVLPLDGGLLMTNLIGTVAGRRTLALSLTLSALAAFVAAGWLYHFQESPFMLVLFAYFGVNNLLELYRGRSAQSGDGVTKPS